MSKFNLSRLPSPPEDEGSSDDTVMPTGRDANYSNGDSSHKHSNGNGSAANGTSNGGANGQFSAGSGIGAFNHFL
jgi:hypothetical protein